MSATATAPTATNDSSTSNADTRSPPDHAVPGQHLRDAPLGALEAALENSEAPAAAVDVEGDRVTVLMMCPDPALVPERKPSITPSGSPSLKKRTKTEFNELYLSAIASYVLATVKETFAVAPSLRQARLVALRHEPSAGMCADRLVALFAGTFTRDLMRGARWDAIDLTRVL